MAESVNERVILATAIRGARTIVAPFQVEILDGDVLVVKYLGATVLPQIPLQLQISFRQLFQGEITSSRYIVPVTADGLIHTFPITLGAGYLLSMSAHPLFTALQGSFWCQASITRTSGIEELYLMPLLQGYPTIAQVLAWPGSPLQAQSDGQWYPRDVALTLTGGASLTNTVPAYAQWQVNTYAATLSTSATVANRFPVINFTNFGGLPYWSPQAPPAHVASTIVAYRFAKGTYRSAAVAGNVWNDVLPLDLMLRGGDVVNLTVTGIQAGDTWLAGEMTVLERLSFV